MLGGPVGKLGSFWLGATAPSLIGRCGGTPWSTLYYFTADRNAEALREG